ncbi:MAG: SMC-Scp complex subunit ScpB [Desulfobacterales bacterium]|nr:SMC-Scp complex subunit ScpB [Desulfobacterales bacterium]
MTIPAEQELKNIVETLLFVADTPLSTDRIRSVVSADVKEIKDVLSQLSKEYEERKGGFSLMEIAGGYQIRTRPEYSEWIKKLVQPNPLRMSKAALETLTIIAYKQPIIRSEIEHIRGVDSGGILRMLLELKLIRVLGRKEIPGRPLIYSTTKRFLEIFGLKDLKDLPTPEEIKGLVNPSFPERENPDQLPLIVTEEPESVPKDTLIEEDGKNILT